MARTLKKLALVDNIMAIKISTAFLLALIAFLEVNACNAEGINAPDPAQTIVIEGKGLYADNISSDETKAFCSDFILGEQDVREFFLSARPITEREYSHDLSGSNCHSIGTLTDVHEKKQWRIDRARRGLLIDSTGGASYYYCNACTSDTYYEPCDIECEHGQ